MNTNNPLCHIKDSGNERGVALIVTIGLLGLLMTMTLAFTTNALVERKAAENCFHRSRAQKMTQSAFNRVLAVMSNYDINAGFSHCDSDTHPAMPNANHGTSDWLCELDTEDVFEWSPDYSDINWEYISVRDAEGGERLVGRYAYVMLPSPGCIDPGAMVKNGVDESNYEEQRIGAEVNEINIRNVNPSTISTDHADKMNHAGTGNGAYTGNWIDFDTLFTTIGVSTANTKKQYRDFFIIDAKPSNEAFWLDQNSDGVIDDNELYNRFNLARTDWDSLAVTNILAAPQAFDKTDTDGAGIQWLNDFGKDSNGADDASMAGDFTSVAAKRNQLAANLIDYCDSDSDPTHDWGGAYSTPPSYVGIDKCPYVNEIQFRITGNPIQYDSPTDTYDWADGVINSRTEVVYMYDDSSNFPEPTVKLSWDITFNAKVDGTIYGTQTRTYTSTPGLYGSSGVPPEGYLKGNLSAMSFGSFGNSISGLGAGLPTSVEVVFNKVDAYLLDSGGNLLDYARIVDPASPVTINGIEGTNDYIHIAFEINDPRHNQFAANWSVVSGAGDSAFDPGTRISPYTNSVCAPHASGDGDGSAGDDPWEISTAHIANIPIISPWELGAIHRGGNWETINLKAHNANANTKSGGGPYADGDANILNQIKMSTAAQTPKKVNLTDQREETHTALIRKIRIGSDYDDPGNGGTEINTLTNKIDTIVAKILDQNAAFLQRSEVAKVTELFDGTCGVTQNTDARKEELIGKLINLTDIDTASEYFTVLVLAQSIRDRGEGVTLNFDLDDDGDAGEESASEIEAGYDINGDGDSDDTTGIPETIANCQLNQYDQFADQIVSTRKLKAEIHRDPDTKKCAIMKLEYLE